MTTNHPPFQITPITSLTSIKSIKGDDSPLKIVVPRLPSKVAFTFFTQVTYLLPYLLHLRWSGGPRALGRRVLFPAIQLGAKLALFGGVTQQRCSWQRRAAASRFASAILGTRGNMFVRVFSRENGGFNGKMMVF